MVPVVFGILDARDGLAHGFAAKREAGLCNPNGLALGCSLGGTQSVVEKGLAMDDVVLLRFLEIGVAVEAKKIGSIHDYLVGAVDPGRPGINVTHRGTRKSRVVDDITDLLDIVGDRQRSSSWILLILKAGR